MAHQNCNAIALIAAERCHGLRPEVRGSLQLTIGWLPCFGRERRPGIMGSCNAFEPIRKSLIGGQNLQSPPRLNALVHYDTTSAAISACEGIGSHRRLLRRIPRSRTGFPRCHPNPASVLSLFQPRWKGRLVVWRLPTQPDRIHEPRRRLTKMRDLARDCKKELYSKPWSNVLAGLKFLSEL